MRNNQTDSRKASAKWGFGNVYKQDKFFPLPPMNKTPPPDAVVDGPPETAYCWNPSWSRQRPHDGSRGCQPTVGITKIRLRRGSTLWGLAI